MHAGDSAAVHRLEDCIKRLVKVAAVAIAGILGAGIVAAPAHATVAQEYIMGTGTPTDDWNDEGTLSATQHADSYATGVWQSVLYADGPTEPRSTDLIFDRVCP